MKNIFLAVAVFTASGLYAFDFGVRDIKIDDIVREGAGVTTEIYPDADEVLLDSVHLESYNEDGTSYYEDDSFTKILTEKGRRENMTASLHLSAAYETTEILHAQIIGEDGSVTDIDTNRYVSVMTETSQMNSNIYDPNQKSIKISYPNLKIGDTVRLHLKSTTFKARIPGVWSDYAVFENTSPIRKYTYCISAPDALPPSRIRVRDEIEGTIHSFTNSLPGSRTMYRWEIRDVPQLFPEPDMPAAYTVAQRMLFSTAESWEKISKWYWELCKPRIESTTEEMIRTVEELKNGAAKAPDGKPDRDAVVRDIFTWVSQNIRYMGITTEKEAPGYEPHDISMTYSNRYGVCRDKAALLVGMLRLAGIESFPVLIHAGEKRDPEVPMTFFNHAIVSVRNEDGSYILMDPTNESSRDLLPAYLDNKSYLVASPEGEGLLVSPVTPSSANMLSVRTNAEISENGTLSLNAEISFKGLNDSLYRGAFARMPAEQRKMFFDGVLKRRLSGATLEKLEISPADLQETDKPLEVRLSATVKDFPATGEKATLLSIPWLSSSLGYVNFLIGNTGLEERRFPLVMETACGTEEVITLYLPENFSAPVCLPDGVNMSTNGLAFTMNVEATGRLLTASRGFAIEVPEIPAANYRSFKDSLKDIEYANRQQALFGPVSENSAPDQRIISEKVRYEVYPLGPGNNMEFSAMAATTTVSVVREILTYAGKKKNAELKIPFNPAWETAEIIEAAVSNLNGTVQSVQPHEINIMDAPWAASAPRYPAGKTMVVSLPGVETGSVITTTIRTSVTNILLAPFSHSFQNFDPTERSEFSVSYHASLMEPAISEFNLSGVQNEAQTNAAGIVTRSWKIAKPRTLPREENLPPAYEYQASVYGALGGSWRIYRAALSRIVGEASSMEASRKSAQKAAEITDGIKEDAEKVRAVRDYVVKNIRLAGPSFTDIPLAATDADITLADGYGHALDRAVLIYAMLKSLGFSPALILADPLAEIAPGRTGAGDAEPRYRHPSYSVFTVPLVAVNIPDTVFLNDTDQYARLGVTSMAGRSFLPVTGDGEFPFPARTIAGGNTIYRIELDESLKNRAESEKVAEIDENGSARITVSERNYGTRAAALSKKIAEMPPEERRRYHLSLIGDISVSAESCGPLITETDGYPALISYSVFVPRYAVRSGNTMTLRIGNPSPLISLRSDKRESPLSIPETEKSSSKTTIILPESAEEVLLAPPDISLDLGEYGIPGGYLDRTSKVYRNADGRLCMEITTSRKLNRSVVGRGLYPAILEINRRLLHPSMGNIVIRCGAPEAR